MFTRFRSMPATAMAAVLGCALIATAAVPAAAQDKPKKEKKGKQEEAKGTTVAVSKAFGPAVKKMQDASNAKDSAALAAAIAEGSPSATTDEDRYWIGQFTLQLGIQTNDKAKQAAGLDAMLASGKTPPESLATYNFFSGNFAYGDKDYAKAAERLEAAKAGGSKEQQLDLLLMDSYIQSNQVDRGIAVAKTAIEANRAAGQRPSDELYVRPIKALQAAKRNDEALDMMTLRMRDFNQPQVWRQTLFILLQQSGENKEIALDTLRLMRATNSMLQRPEYLEYATLATEAALPGEVVSLIKAGKASNVIPQADARLDEIAKAQGERIGDEESTLTAYAAKPSTLSNPKVAGATGDAMVGYGRYADAVPLYKAALAAGGDKELWTYRMGVAQALAGDAAGAKASFAQVTGARKRLAQLWTIKLDGGAAPAAATAAG
ncbi:tetratricopeptide repeat protein [Sphingopyxis sp. YF1]|uniref:tetratricopeptide repeat protein n=1 Tax=Sphingopyxis sp. YF1 TaxID=2482763 RepID=UPI001F622542|nr:tetratricopeptide repeat protein [Sphingopyxis sp. YF1]UNU42645.1 tetratricopeptide repeat protein [Sphingopyxis sp. YF1]